MTGNILIIKGMSSYNVLRLAADEMIDAYIEMGYDVTVFDMIEQNNFIQVFNSTFEKSYDLIFSFQALVFEIRIPDTNDSFLNSLNTPVFGHIVDHPLFHHHRLLPPQGDNIYLGFIDRNHMKYYIDYYANIANAVYLSHAGFKAKNLVPYEERTIDIYFPSSYNPPADVFKEIDTLPNVFKNMATLLIKKMLANPLLTLQAALSDYLSQIKFEHSREEFIDLINLFHVVDRYIRSHHRDKCVHCLLDNNINVSVSGAGWDKFVSSSANNLTILSTEGLDILDTLEIMGNSKMILNSIPTLQAGMHERIFTSMRCGAICLTDDFPCVHEEFTEGENILLYSNLELQSFAEKVKKLLASPKEASKIAEKGNQIASRSHTWYHNAEKILEIVGIRNTHE